MENNNQNSNTNKPMTAEDVVQLHAAQLLKEKDGLLNEAKLHSKITFDYAAQQTAELRKQLAEKEADIERVKSLRRFSVDYWHEDGYVESDISEDKEGEWVKWSDVERILSQKGAGDE